MRMFHVKRFAKTLLYRGFFVFLVANIFVSCITPRHTVEIDDYALLANGKQILGHDAGLTAFIFENNQRKMPFQQFLAGKYDLGNTEETAYFVMIDGNRFKVMLYENAELGKYFDMSQFMVTNVETQVNRIGSSANFLGISVVNNANEDCLEDGSLYQNMVIKYLRDLKFEYNNN
jgi:hypothetical protein